MEVKAMDLYGAFSRIAEVQKENEALVVWQGGRRTSATYQEIREDSDKIAQALFNLGLKRGQRCAILAQSGILWAKIALAISKIGALFVPIDPDLPKERAEEILKEVQPEIILVDENLVEKVNEDFVGEVVILGNKSRRYFTLRELLFKPQKSFEAEKVSPLDPLVVIYTSGTTGAMKGAVLTHAAFLNLTCRAAVARLGLTPNEVAASIGPFHHVMGFFALVTMLTLGAKLVFTRDYKRLLTILSQERGTVLLTPPKLFRAMYQRIVQGIKEKGTLALLLFKIAPWMVGRKLREKLGLENLRFFVSGSAKIGPQIVKGFRRLGFGFVEGYGMTEDASLSHISTPFNRKPGSVGPLIPGMKQKILKVIFRGGVPITLNKEAKPGEWGELCLQGPNITLGYLEKPELTKEVLDEEGWLHTGDYGMVDKRGWLWLKGRLREIKVTSGGKNVSLVKIEETLLGSPLIEEIVADVVEDRVCIQVYPSAELRQRICEGPDTSQCIRENTERFLEFLWPDINRLNRKLAPYERVAKINIQISPKPFPKTTTLKIQRFQVVRQ
jgi:long-chain acyl-CoA synthetase